VNDDDSTSHTEALGDHDSPTDNAPSGTDSCSQAEQPSLLLLGHSALNKRRARDRDDDDAPERQQPPVLSPHKRPRHICHVCNIEHSHIAGGDWLQVCNHPDGCGRLAHPNSCSLICPRFPEKTICNRCYCPGKVLEHRPDLVIGPQDASTGITYFEARKYYSIGRRPSDGTVPDPDAGAADAPSSSAASSAEQPAQLGWKWSPQVEWSEDSQRFQGQVSAAPWTVPQEVPLAPLAHSRSQCHVCNPYCIHNDTPDITLTLRSLLRTAQNLAECHTMLAESRSSATEP